MNLIFSITNIVKGDNQNRLYFFHSGGSSKFISFALDNTNSTTDAFGSEQIKIIDMCT